MKIELSRAEAEQVIFAMYSGIENESALADSYWDNLFNRPLRGGQHGKSVRRVNRWTRIRSKIIAQMREAK